MYLVLGNKLSQREKVLLARFWKDRLSYSSFLKEFFERFSFDNRKANKFMLYYYYTSRICCFLSFRIRSSR